MRKEINLGSPSQVSTTTLSTSLKTSDFFSQEGIIPGPLGVLLGALAGGMGWGIRGQYGHETGAMLAGVLVGLVIVLVYLPYKSAWAAFRAAALFAVGIGIGGSMTYGQTIGLTHDPNLLGNWPALKWGMLGLAIKGGLWIGFAGLFLGTALSGIRYAWFEWLVVLLVALLVHRFGVWLLNSPFDPANRVLPYFYFSADWRWQPLAELKPRPEVWGGYLLVFLYLLLYTTWGKGDPLAWRLGLWAFLGGAIGFPAGQCWQAAHAWNIDWFKQFDWDKHINWWNMMEITFGTIMGATVCFGVWIHRRFIGLNSPEDKTETAPWEWLLLAIHLVLLYCAEFTSTLPILSRLYDDGIPLVILPVCCIVAGRWWPLFVLLPVTLFPIVGKSIRHVVYQEQDLTPWVGWIFLVALPSALSLGITLWSFLGIRSGKKSTGTIAAVLLIFCSWIYFGLNFAFFKYPFPWNTWTARTPSNLIFTVCVTGLTIASICFLVIERTRLSKKDSSTQE